MIRFLTILLIATIGSGCASHIAEPLCLPSRPFLFDLSDEEAQAINDDTLEKIAINDARLKSHIKTIEQITEVHNKQFEARCAED